MGLKPEQFTEQAKYVLRYSQELVRTYQHGQWDVEHIVLAMLGLENGLPEAIFSELNVSIQAVRSRPVALLEAAPKLVEEVSQLYTTPRVQRLLEHAGLEAELQQGELIGVEHLFLAS